MLTLLALNSLPTVDIVFFVLLGVIIALCVGIYFLIPVINRKQYQEMRDNLNKREVAFNAGKQSVETADETVEAEQAPTTQEE